jgi:hypothetical protein
MVLEWSSPLRQDGRRGFADWIRRLQHQNGVYLIRDAETEEVQYIGESHRARLYHTLTRHLQSWSGFGSGPTYDPTHVEIAVVLTSAEEAPATQFALIQQFRPPDNVQDGRSLFLFRGGGGPPAGPFDDDEAEPGADADEPYAPSPSGACPGAGAYDLAEADAEEVPF